MYSLNPNQPKPLGTIAVGKDDAEISEEDRADPAKGASNSN